MAEAQLLPQPQPRQAAQYLRNAADQIALFENLPTFTNDQMLRENTRSIAAMGVSIEALQVELREAVRTLQNNMTTLNTTIGTTIGTLRTDMSRQFDDLNTKLESTEQNARARLDNSRVTSRNQHLTVIKTKDNTEPRGFPTTPGQLSSITGREGATIIDKCLQALAENLNPLLTAYELPRDGAIDVKRRRFRTFIGMADIV